MSSGERTIGPSGDAVRDACALAEAVTEEAPSVRLVGSVAVFWWARGDADLLARLGRRPPADIDLWCRPEELEAVDAVLVAKGFIADAKVSQSWEWGSRRLTYAREEVAVDVFVDPFTMSHAVRLSGDRPSEAPVASRADLLLTKLQVHEATSKDLVDLVVVVRSLHADGGIDPGPLVAATDADWGLWRDALRNLEQAEALAASEAAIDLGLEPVGAALARLVAELRSAPRSRRWRARAAIGDRVRYWNDVLGVD